MAAVTPKTAVVKPVFALDGKTAKQPCDICTHPLSGKSYVLWEEHACLPPRKRNPISHVFHHHCGLLLQKHHACSLPYFSFLSPNWDGKPQSDEATISRTVSEIAQASLSHDEIQIQGLFARFLHQYDPPSTQTLIHALFNDATTRGDTQTIEAVFSYMFAMLGRMLANSKIPAEEIEKFLSTWKNTLQAFYPHLTASQAVKLYEKSIQPCMPILTNLLRPHGPVYLSHCGEPLMTHGPGLTEDFPAGKILAILQIELSPFAALIDSLLQFTPPLPKEILDQTYAQITELFKAFDLQPQTLFSSWDATYQIGSPTREKMLLEKWDQHIIRALELRLEPLANLLIEHTLLNPSSWELLREYFCLHHWVTIVPNASSCNVWHVDRILVSQPIPVREGTKSGVNSKIHVQNLMVNRFNAYLQGCIKQKLTSTTQLLLDSFFEKMLLLFGETRSALLEKFAFIFSNAVASAAGKDSSPEEAVMRLFITTPERLAFSEEETILFFQAALSGAARSGNVAVIQTVHEHALRCSSHLLCLSSALHEALSASNLQAFNALYTLNSQTVSSSFFLEKLLTHEQCLQKVSTSYEDSTRAAEVNEHLQSISQQFEKTVQALLSQQATLSPTNLLLAIVHAAKRNLRVIQSKVLPSPRNFSSFETECMLYRSLEDWKYDVPDSEITPACLLIPSLLSQRNISQKAREIFIRASLSKLSRLNQGNTQTWRLIIRYLPELFKQFLLSGTISKEFATEILFTVAQATPQTRAIFELIGSIVLRNCLKNKGAPPAKRNAPEADSSQAVVESPTS